MGLMDFIKAGTREMMIARPDDKKQLVVWKWPDQNIPYYAQLTVDSDEVAVFFKEGRVMGVLPGGQRHTLTTQNVPFLNHFIQGFTGGNVFIAEVFFVKTQPVRNLPVGGPIGEMLDPYTGELATPRIFGEFSVVVVDPARFIVAYVGQAAAGDNAVVFDWVKQLFLLGVKTTVGELCEQEGKSLLQVVALSQTLAQRFVAKCQSLEDIGVRVYQMGNFQINFAPEDRKRLQEAAGEIAKADRSIRVKRSEAQANQFALDQQFQQDQRYVQQVAGNFQNYAAGKAMLGAGEGMAKGGEGAGVAAAGAQLGVGLGMANFAHQNAAAPQGPQFAVPGGAGQAQADAVACPKCHAPNTRGAKFCAECGTSLAPPAPAIRSCNTCGTQNTPGAKFCSNCGGSLGAAATPPTG